MPSLRRRPKAKPAGLARGLFHALLAALVLGCAEPAPSATRSDVLLITIDTLRADHLGAYGMHGDISPAIDELARRGHVFERAIAASPSTVPSHASIMTSRFTRQHSVGFGNGNTRLDEKTLAELFRQAGYATAAFVGNAMLQRRVGLDSGFDVYDDDLPETEATRTLIFERIAPQTTERALSWLAQTSGSPVFSWVHYQDSHGPYTPPESFVDRIPDEDDAAEETLPVLSSDAGWHGIPRYQALPGLTRPSEYRRRYAAEVLFADASLAKLLAAFDARARRRGAPSPIVLLTSDHGESLGEEDRYFSHSHSTTPDLAHVPMIVAAPGLGTGRSRDLVAHVDILPTLIELAGLPVPEDAQGVALGPVVEGTAAMPDRYVYCDMGSELSAYRGDRFVRGRGMKGAWRATARGGESPIWSSFTWRASRPRIEWSRLRDGDDLPPEIEAYAREATPMRRAEALSETQQQRLRALGYLE